MSVTAEDELDGRSVSAVPPGLLASMPPSPDNGGGIGEMGSVSFPVVHRQGSSLSVLPNSYRGVTQRAPDRMVQEIRCMTWNLHGKGIKHVSSMLDGLETAPEILFLQEVGDVRDLAEGTHFHDLFVIAGQEFAGYVANPRHSWRSSVILFACSLEFTLLHVHVLDIGLYVAVRMLHDTWHCMTLHFPHAHRPDASEVWRNSCAAVQEHLGAVAADHKILVGHDLNQDAHARVDSFSGMLHYRQLLARTSLEISPPQGDTWFARGSSSPIDFLLFRLKHVEVSYWKREDFRISLPSDHNAIGLTMCFKTAVGRRPRKQRSTLCGKWSFAPDLFFKELEHKARWDQDTLAAAARVKGVSTRLPSLRYVDPPEIKNLITTRKSSQDADLRAALMQEIHQLRQLAQQRHKEDLLEKAQSGDHRAIAHLRASAAGSFTEGSYIHRAGGHTQALEDLYRFYENKFFSEELPLNQVHFDAARARHCIGAPPEPITLEEVQETLARCNAGVSAGLDGITYEGLKGLLRLDSEQRLVQYLNALLVGEQPIPPSWKVGKIVFLPKVPRPDKLADLRPICLVPTLSRLYSKILMQRIRTAAPPYKANQMACRTSVQVVDGILAAQSTMSLLRHITGSPAKVAKLDLRAAFDSLSHHAVYRWLMACQPCWEAERLMHLCFGTKVQVGLAGESRVLEMKQGIMQGSAFSADVFSRVVDWFLGDLLPAMLEIEPTWEDHVANLPHFLVYADDITVFATTEAALQSKVRMLVSTLAVLGLHINPAKCRVLHDPEGTCPGLWLPGKVAPLQGEPSLLFLGVPLGHGVNASTTMTHLMRKASNSFFAFKKILDKASTTLSLKFRLFDVYISSRWLWAAPTMFPDMRMLKSIEGSKNTYLLSLCRVGTDMLLSWIDNTVSRRRSVRLLCSKVQGPDWRRAWLTRVWKYHGHLARCLVEHPMKQIARTCSSGNLRRGLRASWLTDLTVRKLQRVFVKLPGIGECRNWEEAAQDRHLWEQLLPQWLSYWIPVFQEPIADLDYLCQRQLVVLRTKRVVECVYLRPSRDVLDEPYVGALWEINEVPRSATNIIWLRSDTQGCYAVLQLPRCTTKSALGVQVRPSDNSPMSVSLALLTLGTKLGILLQTYGYHDVHVVAPPSQYQRGIFQENVPLAYLAELTALRRLWDQSGKPILCLPGSKVPARSQALLENFCAVVMPTKYLVRTADFSDARFLDDFRQLHTSLWHML